MTKTKTEFVEHIINKEKLKVCVAVPTGRAGTSRVTPMIKSLNVGDSLFFWENEWDLKTAVKSAVGTLSAQSRKKLEVKKYQQEETNRIGYVVSYTLKYK